MKIHHKILFLIFLWTLACNNANGQRYELAEDPQKFMEGANLMLDNMSGAQAVFTRANLDSIWLSVSNDHQQKIVAIARKMQIKNYPAHPHFLNFFTTITHAYMQGQASDKVLSNFYNVLDKSIENKKSKEVNTFLSITANLFNRRYLYHTNFNRLLLDGGSFDFEYVETKLPETSEIPPQDNEEQAGAFDDWDADNNWSSDDDWSAEDSDQSPNDGWDDNGSGWGNETTDAEEKTSGEIFAQSEQALYEALTEPKPQPVVEGPVLQLKNVNMIFTTTYDSVGIKNTNGSLMLKNEVFVGKGGTFNWAMAGLDPNETFVTFSEYSFNISKPYLEAEKVDLTYKKKLNETVEGIFSFESSRHDGPEDADFPRFKSYNNDVVVNDVAGDELTYKGGFSLRGRKILGASVIPGTSEIQLKKDGKVALKAFSEYFVFGDTVLNSKAAKIALYMQRDSIVHPEVRFRYYTNQKQVIIRSSDGLYKKTPFWASYYNMEINADMIRWDLDSSSFDITTLNARNQIPAQFTSKEYYNDVQLVQLTGMYGFNPLLMAVSYGRKIKKKEFYYTEMAQANNQNPEVVKDAMLFLMGKGFVQIDKYGKVRLNDKAIHYTLSSFKRKDYDDLLFNSLTDGSANATLNLENQELAVRGIKRFYISRPLDVYIYPDSSTVTLMKNRDFKFNGQLYAGNFEFIGRDFTFRYDSFLVDMTQIDSIRFYIEVKDEKTGKLKRQRVDNKLIGGDTTSAKALSGISTSFDGNSGTLFINKPNNKSGLRTFPNYPVFDASQGAVVYFDNNDVLDNAYDRSVHFVIPPFKIDSLSGSDPATIGFDGTFVSGGIIPNIKEKLHIMPDNTLGFKHKVPEEGYNLYGGSAKVFNELTLSGNGLNGEGTIDYLTTTLNADNYVFYPDSVTTNVGTSAVIRPGTLGGASFPEAKVDSFKLKWMPYQDSMYVSNFENNPFQFYNASASMYGTAIINKNGLYGNGKLFTRGSESESPEMNFTETAYSARHAKFKINSDNPEKPALAGNDINLDFDLINNEAEISPEIEGVAAIDFPYAQFKTSISQAVWNLDNRKITMAKPENVAMENTYFYSTRKELDSLAFNGTQAEYDIDSLKLYIQGIPYIKVADALITPESNEITIYENSRIGTLENTTVVIDTVNQYHTMIDGTIDIISRNKFLGDATYRFVNARSDTFRIKFGKFDLVENEGRRRARDLYTVSSGNVTQEDELIISPGMIFKGQATMYAIKRPLELEGEVQLDFKNIENYDTWIKYYSNEEQRTDIAFDFKTAETTEGESLTAGLHFNQRDYSLYHTFITDKITPADDDFFVPDGILSYNFEKEYYEIVDTLKTSGETYSGKIFTFNEDNGDMSFEGPVKFITSTEAFQMQSAAIGTGNAYRQEFEANTFLMLEIDMPSQASDAMALDIFDVVERLVLPEANDDQTKLLYKAAEIIGENNAIEYEKRNQEEYVPLWGVSNDLVKNLVISDINLTYSKEHKAWYSEGKIGISNILRQDINAKVDGFLELKKTENGDMFNMFLQVSAGSWYHFSYYDNRLILSSSNPEFNDVVSGKTNVDKAKLGEYVFVPGDVAEALTFVNRFRKEYYGLDDPYNINMAAQQVEQPTDILPGEVEEKDVTNETEGF